MITLYKDNIIDALKHLADCEFQKIAWFENDQGLLYSYNENVLDLFYDSGLDEALYSGKVVFSYETDDILRDLEKETQKIEGDDYLEEEIIDMPQMQVIRKKAAQALELVMDSDDTESEVRFLMRGQKPYQ